MSFSIVEHKLRVFISSRCGGKGNRYTIARKSLKTLLESTMLIDVYAFETEPASSQDTIDSYLNYIDESNLCIFLVDNKDDISDAVLREQNRAKEKNLRLIYIFCDEKKKTPTAMQEEIKQSFSEKYYVVHEFSDIVEIAYQSVMQDIIAIYKEKKPLLHTEEINSDDFSSTKIIENEIKYNMDKERLLNFPFTIQHIKSTIAMTTLDKKIEPTNLDKLISSYFDLVMRKRKFDITKHEELSEEIMNNQDCSLNNVLSHRFNAISYYYQDDLNLALTELQNAIEEAANNPSIPNWLALDIAIDIRYIQSLIDEVKSQHTINKIGEEFISQNVETLYYPLFDRKYFKYYNELTNEYFKSIHKSPYTIQFGGFTYLLTHVAEAFCIAAMHGSLIHTENTRHKIVSFFQMICSFNNYHDYNLELLKMLILTLSNNQLKDFMRVYDAKITGFNNADVLEILKCVETIPISHRKNMSTFLTTSYLGDYMNDSTFEEISSNLITYSIKWAQNNSRIFDENSFIFDFYMKNILRISVTHILSFVVAIIGNKLLRFTDNCFKLMQSVDFSQADANLQEQIMLILIDFISGKLEIHNKYLLENVVISFVLKSTISNDKLIAALKQYHLDFFNTTFFLETEKGDHDSLLKHIVRYLNMADVRSENEGKDGLHSEYAFEPYDIIVNILLHHNIALQNNDINAILDSVIKTLKSKDQSTTAKLSASHLLMFLYSSYDKYNWLDTQQILNDNYNLFSTGYESHFETETNQMLKFSYDLMLCGFDNSAKDNIIESIFTVDLEDSLLLIYYLKDIEMYLRCFRYFTISEELIIALMHFCIIMSTHSDIDVQFYAILCLINLTHYKISHETVLKQLSKIMDNGSPKIKSAIVSRVSKMSVDDNTYIDYILKKGKINNNYLVRYATIRESSEINNGEL